METKHETQTAHTPGPWHISDSTDKRENHYVRASESLHSAQHGIGVCKVCDFPEWKANARLIAAAPDLLAALRELYINMASEASLHTVCDYCGRHHTKHASTCIIDKARAAIARAEGQ